MGDSEEHLDFMLFLDNYVQAIQKTCVKKCFWKETHRNIVTEIYEETLMESFFNNIF